MSYGSGRKLAADAQLKLAHDKRAEGRAHETVETLVLVTDVLDKAVRQDKIAGHKITDIMVEDNGTARHDDFVFPTFKQVDYLATKIGIVIWLMRGCGLRIAEALAVEKADFRNGGKTLRVSGQATRDGLQKVALKHRKAGEYRDVPVPAWLWEKVRDLPEGPLCPGRGDRRYAIYATVNDAFRRHVPLAGIQGRFTNADERAIAALDREFAMWSKAS